MNYYDAILSRTDDREAALSAGLANAKKAIAIDQRDYAVHWALGRLHYLEGDHRAAVRELETSININPNFAHGYYGLSVSYLFSGQPEKAIEFMNIAIRLSPNDPLMWALVGNKGIAYGQLRDFDKAIENLEEACRFPTAQFVPFTMLAALHAITGSETEAKKLLDRARELEPNLSVNHMRNYYSTADQEAFEVFIEGFRLAGLTD